LPSFISALLVLVFSRLSLPFLLGMLYGVSEIFLGMTRRSGSGTLSRDRRSLVLLWIVIGLSIFLAQLALSTSVGRLPHPRACSLLGLFLFAAGISLRWYAIIYLGRFFTVDVAIAPEHEVIDSGPYRWIRHPSYTGAILAFVGFGLLLRNWLALLCLILPIAAAFLWRIHVEEHVLSDALGDRYRAYMRRTKRLLPFIY
jgi:protein-S-isoprenylcysteine O-methyltransferase